MAHSAFLEDSVQIERGPSGVAAFFNVVGAGLAAGAASEARSREIVRLQGLTDDELGQMGLTRDRIVHHVYQDIAAS